MTSITVNSILQVAYSSLQNHIVTRCPLSTSNQLTIASKSFVLHHVFPRFSTCRTFTTHSCPFHPSGDADNASASQSTSSSSSASTFSSSSSSSLTRKHISSSSSSPSSSLTSSALSLVKSVSANMSTDATAARCPFSFHPSLDAQQLSDVTTDHDVQQTSPIDGVAEVSQTIVRSYTDLPTPKGFRLFGTSLDLIRRGGAAFLHEYCDSLHKQLGPIYRERLGPQECVFIADSQMVRRLYQNEGKHPRHLVPEAWLIYNEIKGIERGLFFMNGPEWEERRRALNKVFLRQPVVSNYSEAFNQVVTDMIERWDKLIPKKSSESNSNTSYSNCNCNSVVNGNAHSDSQDTGLLKQLEKELYKWSIESLATMIFGRRLGCLSGDLTEREQRFGGDRASEYVHEFVKCVHDLFVESTTMTVVPAKLAHSLNLPVWRRFMSAAGRALQLARDYVQENLHFLKSGKKLAQKCKHQGVLESLLNEHNIHQEEVVRIVTDLFLAAADTTSHAAQWALYLLSKHPHVQEKIYQEVKAVVGENGYLKEKHLKNLPHVRGVMKESLRLYPIAPFLSRTLSHDIILGGYRIPAGVLLVVSLYTTSRDNRYFCDGNTFRPERWIRNRSSTGPREVINNHASIPFGIGVRSCVGRKVAEIQMQLLISRVVQKFFIEPGKEKDIGIKLRMVTTPEEPIYLRLRRRKEF